MRMMKIVAYSRESEISFVIQRNSLEMKKALQKRVFILALILFLLLLGRYREIAGSEREYFSLLRLKYQVLEFARKHQDQEVIVVSKSQHLLFFCRQGEIVTREKWQGFTYSFPVGVALAAKYYRTPEGEMFIDGKNPASRYIRFLSFSYPGAYGIHSAPTAYRSFLEKMELKNPDFAFATLKDNTRGCVQVENRVIKYLFANVAVGTPVLIMP